MKSTIKKISMILTGLLFSMVLCAQVAVTVDNTPGNLKNNLADKDPGSIVSLTITGTMDARDFKTMRDEMQRLVNVDLRHTTIVAYSGEGGTYPPDYSVYYDYYSNTIPDNAFGHYGLSTNITLKSVQIPLNTLAIGETAFAHCEALTSFTVPSSVTLIGASAFAGCKGLTSFIVPPTVNYIASGVFAECSSLKEVVLPPSLTVIEYLLFEECSSLVSIKIPSGVTSIGSRAFAGCASLADIELPSGLISIGFEAFRGCTSMVNINLPSSVTTIATNAFLGCTALTAISLPSGITKLGQGVFYDCNSLTGKLAIPGGIKSIKEYTFSNCSKLTSIEFSMGTDSIRESAFEGCIAFSGKLTLPSTLVFIGNRAFSGCSLITGELSLPPFLKSIGMFAFAGCRGLNSLTIPPSAESIDEWAFKDCSGLTSIVAGNPYPIALGNGSGVFEGVNKSIPLKVPFGSKELYASAGGWKEFTNIIEESKGIHLSVTTASFGPEGGSNSSITLKANVAWTASSDQAWLAVSPTSGSSSQVLTLTALANTGMTSRTGIITLSSTGLETQSLHVTQESVPYVVQTTTGNFRSLFTDEQYNSITRLTITGTMNAPDIGALRDMPRLAEVDMSGVSITAYHYTIYKDHYTMPANSLPGIEYLSKYSLQYDSSLTSIILPSNLEKIEAEAFKDCLNLTSVTFPSTLTYIGQCAFMNCAGLKEVKLPSSLMQLGNQAFYGCSNLSNVELPESITSLSATFAECTSLKTIKLPSTLKIIGEYTFQGCVQLSQIEIPSQVTTIGMEAFLGCTGLTSVLLPSSVTTIQSDAFTGCSILKRVTLPRSLVSIGTRAFGDCTTLSAVYCYAVHPPLLDNSSNFPVFLNVDMAHCMLYVPFGSKVLYEQAEQWKEFKNIVEMDEFRLPITSFSMEAGQGSVTVAVTSAVQWTATSDQSWLSVSPGSANGSATVTLIAQANASFVTRSAKVAFTINDQQSQDITVIQKGIPATIELTAGNLSSEFSLDELIGMTRLSITGTIDARDFKTIRDRMPSLTELDISAATIAAYKGFDGTVAAYLYEPGQYDANGYYYPANEIPPYALYNGEYDNRERKIIRSIHLPDSLQSIGTYAFYRLTQLDSMIIPPAVTNIGSNAFAGTSSLTTVVLPPKLRHFPIYLFYNSGLTSINIPPAVTFIGYLAFGNCKNLTTVYSNALFPPEADLDYNFQGAPMFGLDKSNITLYVPYGARGAYAAAPNEWKEFTNVVELPGFRLSAAILAVKAAQGSTAKAAIQSDVQWTATSDQSWLAVSPSSGTGADSITFTAQANTMDAGRMATVIISAPDVVSQTITVIQEGKPRTIALTPGNMASVLTSEEMSGITNLTITGVMDARDFRIMKDQMPLLTYLDMSKVKIAEFQEPDPITGEIFTNRVNMIPNGAFFDQKTWKGKTSLTEVIFPQTLEKIGLRAFSNAAGLTVLRFPFTMRYIEMNAFNNCPYVTSIYSYALAPPPSHDWGTSFYNVDKTNCILYVPYGSKELYAASQWWKDFQNIVEMAEFKIMTSKATMKATRDIVRMRIQSQVAWTAEPSEEWLTVNPASGNDDQAITITAEANPTDILRTGTVTFRATGYLPQIFTLTQEGLPKPVNLTAGNLASLFTPEELKQITSLVITGTMDARDFKVIRDQMPWLGYLDLTGVTITAYSGNEGTYYGDYNYPANAIPPYALHTDNQSIPSRLSEILLPSSLALIDNQAFGSSVLTSLIIPPSVTSIGKGAFSYSMRLKEMTIPPSVTALEESLFTGCTGLTAVTLPSSLISIGNYAFQDCDSLKEMLIPSSVESIGEGAFFGCKSLSSVALPSSITTLRESLFQDCFSLTSITIPASVTSVGRFVFFNCSRLDSITLPSSLTLLDEGIFVGCTNLKTFIVPPMVTTIGSREFVNCTNLVSVSIPESVSAIGTVAFEGCINLTSIYVFRADPPQLDGLYKVFNEVNYSNCTLYVPYGSRLNYATAKEWKDFKNIVEMAENQLWPIDANALTTGADVKKTDVEMKCYPNPFTDQMTIDIANPSHRAVSVEIYSISGQKISTLLRAQKGANINCTWNGKDEQGKQVPAGMFLLKVNEETRKVMKE